MTSIFILVFISWKLVWRLCTKINVDLNFVYHNFNRGKFLLLELVNFPQNIFLQIFNNIVENQHLTNWMSDLIFLQLSIVSSDILSNLAIHLVRLAWMKMEMGDFCSAFFLYSSMLTALLQTCWRASSGKVLCTLEHILQRNFEQVLQKFTSGFTSYKFHKHVEGLLEILVSMCRSFSLQQN